MRLHQRSCQVLYWVNGDANVDAENGSEHIVCVRHQHNVKVDADADAHVTRKQALRFIRSPLQRAHSYDEDFFIFFERRAMLVFIGFYLLWVTLYTTPRFLNLSVICLVILIHLGKVYNVFKTNKKLQFLSEWCISFKEPISSIFVYIPKAHG